jgi:hypothetical protein
VKSLRKDTLCGLGVKTHYSLQSGDRSAGSAAPPKIAVFPQPVNLAALLGWNTLLRSSVKLDEVAL